MTGEILGPLDQQIQEVKEQAKLLDKKTKELEEKKQLCDELKIDVIKELEKKCGLNDHKEFEAQFDKFLTLLEDYLKTGSKESKKSLIEIIPVLRDLNKW